MDTPTKEQVWATLQEPAELKLMPTVEDELLGDLIPLAEFIGDVKDGGFIDYDGFGNWATETRYLPRVDVYPSMIKKGTAKAPKWVTHVLWYNR
jgi:hypothetical protein